MTHTTTSHTSSSFWELSSATHTSLSLSGKSIIISISGLSNDLTIGLFYSVIQNVFVILIEEGYMSIKYESTYEWLHMHYHRHSHHQIEDAPANPQQQNMNSTDEIKNTDDLIYPEHEFLYRNYKN